MLGNLFQSIRDSIRFRFRRPSTDDYEMSHDEQAAATSRYYEAESRILTSTRGDVDALRSFRRGRPR